VDNFEFSFPYNGYNVTNMHYCKPEKHLVVELRNNVTDHRVSFSITGQDLDHSFVMSRIKAHLDKSYFSGKSKPFALPHICPDVGCEMRPGCIHSKPHKHKEGGIACGGGCGCPPCIPVGEMKDNQDA